ncbi:MAG: L-threonylcarbamoyladenylate synthase [Candidatus Aenigmarchaeota archaeon]|nr:L-threonylcarbamoyladenylate synthase [Candidatus Aenigmarchaeota archaeon]
MVIKTKIVKLSDKKAVAKAVQVLRKGSLVIYPTETSYGIAADATNRNAIKMINSLKKRAGKFMPIIVSDMRMAGKYIVLNNDVRKLMKKFMPGPLTLVAKKKKLKTKGMLGGFRIPNNRFARGLVKSFGKPITATSANISGEPPIYKIREIRKAFYGKVEMIVDAGNLPKRKPSTVYDAERKVVIREGMIKEKDIIKAIGS